MPNARRRSTHAFGLLLATLALGCSLERPEPRGFSLRIDVPTTTAAGQEVLLGVDVSGAATIHAVEIVDHQLGRTVLVATAKAAGPRRYEARWRPAVSDAEGPYALRAKAVLTSGQVVFSPTTAMIVEQVLTFAKKPHPPGKGKVDAPGDLVATAGDGQVSLGWSPVANATGYYVYRGTAASFVPAEQNRVGNVTVASLTDATVVNGTSYYYRVSSYALNTRNGRVKESGASAPVAAYPTGAPDVAPPVVAITAPACGAEYTSPTTVAVVATATDDVGVARVDFYDGDRLVASDALPPFSHQLDVTAADNGVHLLSARAFDAAGNSATSASCSLTVAIDDSDVTAPTVAITAPAADGSYSAPTTVTLVAAASDDVGVTKVELYDGATLLASADAATLSHSWTVDAAENGAHLFTARAYDAAGNSATSTPRQLVVAIPVAPDAPGGLSAVAGDGSVTLSWSPVAGATSYNLYWATTEGVTPASGTAITDVSAPHVHQGLVNGVAYHYVVTAVRDGIESPPSPAASATPFAPADTTAPTFSGLTSATALGATQVQLSWAPATDDQTPQSGMVYDVYQGTSSALDFSATSQTTAAGATSLTVTGLAAGTTYYFAVRARDAAGNLDDNTVTRAATTHEQSAWPAEWAAHEEEVLTLVNQRRALGATCGDTIYPPAAPLSMQPALREAARLHSQDMATQDYFSHTSLDGRSPWTRCADAGYPCSGENIAAGHATPAHVVAGWTASPGHCANMMKSTFTLIGVGYAYDGTSTYRHYWTQNFGR